MRKVVIHFPIWKTKSIGVAKYKITDDLAIEILHKDNDGSRMYPGEYHISKDKALSYPTQKVRGGVILHIIPIADMEERAIVQT
jgi:hypothetical protein